MYLKQKQNKTETETETNKHSKLSSGTSCFHWSSVSLVYLWWTQLIGHVYIRSYSWQCTSELNLNHDVQRIVCGSSRQDCIEAKIWGRVDLQQEVPVSTVASIICKWKKLGTTKTLHRAGCLANLSSWGRRTLVTPASCVEETKHCSLDWVECRSDHQRNHSHSLLILRLCPLCESSRRLWNGRQRTKLCLLPPPNL